MTTKNRAGKSVLNVPKNSQVMSPVPVAGKSHVAAATSQGRLLVFPIAELPELNRGKGNKIINIPPASLKAREEFLAGVVPIENTDRLIVRAGGRKMRLRFKDLEGYMGERARRGRLLPRGLQRVSALEVEERRRRPAKS